VQVLIDYLKKKICTGAKVEKYNQSEQIALYLIGLFIKFMFINIILYFYFY